MAALFVNLFKMPLHWKLNRKQMSQNVAQIANKFSASSNKCWIITQNKVNNKFGYSGWTLNFGKFGLHVCDISDNIIAAMEF